MASTILRAAILACQRIPLFAARGSYSYPPDRPVDGEYPQAETEYADFRGFLENFGRCRLNFLSAIDGKRVLDFGCGYGGRTVWYAERAEEVHGIEIYKSMVEKATGFANKKGARNCYFSLGTEESIAFPDNTFDVIVSADVIEHVMKPDIVLHEMRRVLKADGLAFIVFTPYFGMFAHHLNYITLLPAVHWFFSPQTIVSTVNGLLSSHPAFAGLAHQQPPPGNSFNGKRAVLPTLNGITKREYLSIVRAVGFTVEFCRTTPILEKFKVAWRVGSIFNEWLCAAPWLDEAFGHNLVTVMRKRL